MELHQLKYFIQVARAESISKAAESLRLSQPALSKTIAKLEEELGVKLFDRVGRRIYLNDRGRSFLKDIEPAIGELERAAASVGSNAPVEHTTLRVGVFGPQHAAIACMEQFMQKHEHVSIVFDARRNSTTSRIAREFDLVFYPNGPSFDPLAGIPYARSRKLAALPSSHPLAHCPSIDLIQLRDDPFVFMNTTAGIFEQSYRLCVDSGFQPWVRAVTSSGAAQMSFIRSGLGVGLIDSPEASIDAQQTSLGESRGDRRARLVAINGIVQEQTLCFASRPTSLLSPAGRELLSFVFAYFGITESKSALDRFDVN